MSNLTFFKMWMKLDEAGEMGGAPPMGGPPGGDPSGGMGGPPGGGDPMAGGMGGGAPMGGGGMDPMGGGMGGGMGMGGTPVPVKTIPAADVWGQLEKLVNDSKNSKFFDEINISRRPQKAIQKSEPKKSSLL